MKITVLAGGLSPERDVSLSSGSLIANALIGNGHEVMLIDLYKGADEIKFYDKASGKHFSYTVPQQEPDLGVLEAECDNNGALIGKNVLEACKQADLAFLALHGSIGENGQLQATLDVFGVKYTGTGFLGSALAMDKDAAKRLMALSGIPTPEWILLDTQTMCSCSTSQHLGFPRIVKPLSCGSSVGVSIAHDRDGLHKAVAAAKKHERYLIVEKMVEGREFSVGVLGGEALPVIEIIPNEGFYDYANKYQPGFTKEVCPAELDPELAKRMQQSAVDVHRALRLGFYSRVDFMLDKDGKHFCLEANTLPGMTPTSLLPQEAAAAGIGYNELCDRIAKSALPQDETPNPDIKHAGWKDLFDTQALPRA